MTARYAIPPSTDPDLDTVALDDAALEAGVDALALLRAIGDGRLRTHREYRGGELVDAVKRSDLAVLRDGASEAEMRASDALLWPGGRAAWGQR